MINEYETQTYRHYSASFCYLQMKTMKVGFGTLTICEFMCCIVYVVGVIGYFDSDK